MVQIKEISAEQTYSLRSKVLRPGRPFEECFYKEDKQKEAFHLAAFLNDSEIVSIASFYKEDFPSFDFKFQYRLRGMATDPDVQGKGYGQTLINECMKHLKKRGAEILWCNARTSAKGFYKRLGFSWFDDVFDIPGIGPHIVMYKKVK